MKTYSHTHDYLVSLLKKYGTGKKPLTIVDYGCGSGALLSHLTDVMIKKYLGFDVNRHSITEAKKNYQHQKQYTFQLISPNTCPSFGPKNSVDVIILVGVWQYLTLTEQKFIAHEASKVLTPKGVLLISCTVDHLIYRLLNVYRLLFPHHYIRRSEVIDLLKKASLKVVYQHESGLLLNPLFSNVIVFFFDMLDQLLHQSRGTIGPIGAWVRRVMHPVLATEFKLSIDYGYTLFIVATKK